MHCVVETERGRLWIEAACGGWLLAEAAWQLTSQADMGSLSAYGDLKPIGWWEIFVLPVDSVPLCLPLDISFDFLVQGKANSQPYAELIERATM